MAESSNSSTTGTTGAGSSTTGTTGAGSSTTTGTTSTSTSTSTSNSGAAASGSQSSSNGSSSTGNGNSNAGPGLSFSGGLASNTGSGWSSNSNGNFSGGLASNTGSGWSSNSNGNFSGGLPGMAPGFTGFASSNFGQGWGSGNGGSSTNNTEHVMTVDEVYGKGNQSIVESQGDYEASSNEKSNVETSTFGKQDEISVTPLSVTEDKGLVDDAAIQSVEGLDFQQKDKANQEVMEAKKSRDDAEAEDNADGMRNQLKAVVEKEAETEDNNAFQVGEETNSKEEADFIEAEKAYKDIEAKEAEIAQLENELKQASKVKNDVITKVQKSDEDLKKAEENASNAEAAYEEVKSAVKEGREAIERVVSDAKNLNDASFIEKTFFKHSKDLNNLKGDLSGLAEKWGVDIGDISKAREGDLVNAANIVSEAVNKELDNHLKEAEETVAECKQWRDEVAKGNAELRSKAVEVDKSFEALRTKYDDAVKSKFEEAPTKEAPTKEAPTKETPAYENTIKAARDEISNSKELSPEQKAKAYVVLDDVKAAADDMKDAANKLAEDPNDISAVQRYVKAQQTYEEAMEDAKGDKTLENTDYNKTFTKAVAAANDFKVTREDGTQQEYSEFAAEMAKKSPELAAGLYEAKADQQEKAGHKMLATINRTKAKMVKTWLGSKFTFADNQVRNQFNQMAETDMRATYATYNNVLNDPNATPEQKAEASASISQANALMTASVALKASTGFFSGIGDGTSDGVYGVTNPGDLNGYQKTLNTAGNFAKIALGLGVTPGANEAYQNMYYLAGAKVNESGLFSKDFDGDGFALCQEYGNNAAVGMIAGAGELAAGIALMFNPATSEMGINLAIEAVQTFLGGLYGVQKEVNKSIKYSNEVLSYFKEAESIATETGNKEAISTMGTAMGTAIEQIEDFQLKSDEVGNLDNWLEGSGSNTADNGKFNQALSYDEWLKLIEADPVMQEYAKSLNR